MHDQLDSAEMRTFLAIIRERYEEALQQNETVDIFSDDFAGLTEEDVTLDNGQTELKELQSYYHLDYCADRYVAMPHVAMPHVAMPHALQQHPEQYPEGTAVSESIILEGAATNGGIAPSPRGHQGIALSTLHLQVHSPSRLSPRTPLAVQGTSHSYNGSLRRRASSPWPGRGE